MPHEVKSPITGTIWMHCAGVGQKIYAGNQVLVLECMKLELPVESPVDGVVQWLGQPGSSINEGDVIAIIHEH